MCLAVKPRSNNSLYKTKESAYRSTSVKKNFKRKRKERNNPPCFFKNIRIDASALAMCVLTVSGEMASCLPISS
jgi:hypothetical protein